MNQANIGKFIAQKRNELNITPEQLAEKLAVSTKTILKWENGKCLPDYSAIKTLCNELGITITELMDGEEQEEKSIRLYDEEHIIDLLKCIKATEKQKNRLKSWVCIFLSASLLIFGIFCSGSVIANIISIVVLIVGASVALVGICYTLKNNE